MRVQFFFFFSLVLGLSLISLEHILLIGVCGLLLALSICLILRIFISSWFGAIAVVVFIGGLLVIFSYFLSIIPNYHNLGFRFRGVIAVSVLGGLILSGLFRGLTCFGGELAVIDVGAIYEVSNRWILIFLGGVLLVNLYVVVSVVSLVGGPLRPFRK